MSSPFPVSRAAAALAVVASTVLVSSCSAGAPPEPTFAPTASASAATTVSTTPTAPRPTLVTWSRIPDGGAVVDALVAGKLAVNDAGCVTIGHAILIAPAGSSVLADGSGVSLSGHGERRLGEMVRDLPGGYGDIKGTSEDPPGIDGCVAHTKPELEYAVVREA